MTPRAQSLWFDGKIRPWEEANVHVMSHALHYGSGVFEGTRFYETAEGPAIFRLQDHTERLFYSAEAMGIEIPYSAEELNEATIAVVRENGFKSGYIRPLIFYGTGNMGLRPQGAKIHTLIAAWEWGKYLSDKPISIKISKYIRIHPKSVVADAKVSGHYVNSILAVEEVMPQGYDEALLLDFEGNLAEGPGENLFVIKDGKIFTPPLGNILNGITRKTLIQLAADHGYTVEEKVMKPEELFNADEAFYTGTAAEVTSIGFLDDQPIADGKEGPITATLKKAYFDLVSGKNKKYGNWLTVVR